MPHRKWRLEFDTGLFPNYSEFIEESNLSVKEAYRVSDVVTLPGTSERVMLLTVPVIGQNGTFYGICGFEVSESYFKYTFSQPSEMEHTIFCLTRGNVGLSDSEACLSAGVADGYYMAPDGEFESRLMNKHGLVSFESDSDGYVGTTKSVRMSPRGEMVTLSTLMPRHDYDGLVMEGVMRIVLLIVLFLMIAVWCCVFFSKRYLNPLLASMEKIRQKEYRSGDSQFKEIEELTKFLAHEEQRSEAELEKIRNEKAEAEAKLEQLRQESDREIKKLACYGKNEVNAEEYMYFCRSIDNLTETERRVFDYYAQGKNVKEIMELMGVKESTIRFHNRNIYATLGVSSLKQLLRFAAIMRQDNEQIDEKES